MSTIRGACARLVTSFVFPVALLVAACGGGPADGQRQKIGTACTDSSQCGSNTHFFCDKDHPNGYCKRDCSTDSDCPPEAICAHDGATVGECHFKCSAVSDCRASEGYICKPASTDPTTLASHSYCDVMDNGGGDDGGTSGDGAPSSSDGGGGPDATSAVDGGAGG